MEQPQEREKQLHELLSKSMVDIYVGPENTHWVLHEKLLCYRSKFFSKIFYSTSKFTGRAATSKTFGLPDEEDEPFKAFVGWLYSGFVKPPKEERELGDLFDLYLMGEKWQIAGLVKDVLDAVRTFYKQNDSFPGLRRVQYIYANTDADSPMRQLLVSSIARMLTLGDGIPAHWDKALRKNAQLAVDIIKSIQDWKISEDQVPDPREEAGEMEVKKVKVVEDAEKNMSDEKVAEVVDKTQTPEGASEDEGDKTLVNGADSE
ncbi:hypothetical protein K402DRAFT_372662 [Aulographum hederae CBS 113979]|uniref:BTB domain-containing protein n=1 Tax=Aulographum hederae CBS 113979 TaxID=1176131 RepID=A0A6G1H7H9_9PEZI|nr:hypothetical protein K402DRAFT_372662 [Aulographum hederae CBS 113979]